MPDPGCFCSFWPVIGAGGLAEKKSQCEVWLDWESQCDFVAGLVINYKSSFGNQLSFTANHNKNVTLLHFLLLSWEMCTFSLLSCYIGIWGIFFFFASLQKHHVL